MSVNKEINLSSREGFITRSLVLHMHNVFLCWLKPSWTSANVAFWPTPLKKSEYRVQPIFLSAQGAVFRSGRGGPHDPPLT